MNDRGFQIADRGLKTRTGWRVSRGRSAFTLIELLLAMFILSIGMTAIVSVFPMATYLQKQTYEEVATLSVSRSAEALLLAAGIPESALDASATLVQPVSNLDTHLPLADRCYPMESDFDVGQRGFYWVPLVLNSGTQTAPDWKVYVVIMAKRPDTDYLQTGYSDANVGNPDDPDTVPKVVRVSAGSSGTSTVTVSHQNNIQPGDTVLLGNGQVVRVATTTGSSFTILGELNGSPGEVWFGKPFADGQRNTIRRVSIVGEEAVQ